MTDPDQGYLREYTGPIKEGDIVKLAFSGTHNEFMWVVVGKMMGDDSYAGKLENDPVVTRGIEHGDVVHFKRCNVYDFHVSQEGK